MFSLVLALLPATAHAQAAATGTVTGQVLDAASGKFLEGAEVAVRGTAIETTTMRDGSFSIEGVPAGAQTLVVSYLGLTPKEVPVTVEANQSVPVPVRLESDVIQLGAVTVTTAREGMAQAVALQKMSVQTKIVAAADQFGPVLEGNVGEYLKFLPGVSIDYNVNDARGVSLRGLSTAFTIVAVDGTPMAGASSVDDTRRFEFEQIAMNNVETTELFKSVTPDIPATATGGFVNFVTKSAFDIEDVQRITYDFYFAAPSSNLSLSKQGGVWGSHKEYTFRPNLELNYARKLTERIGVNINYRFSEKYDDSPRTEFTWNTSTTVPTVMSNPRLQQYNIRSEQKLTHREAFSTKFDFRISDQTKLMVAGQWNWYDLNFTQRGPQFNLGGSSVKSGTDTYTSGAGAQVQNNVLYREKYGTTYHFNANLSHEFANGGELSITPYWSRADGQYRDATKGFISTVALLAPGATTYTSFTLANPSELGTLPTITINGGPTPRSLDYVRDLSNYTFSNTATGGNFQSRPWTAIDRKEGVRADYALDFPHFTLPVKVQVGAQIDNTHRTIERPDYRGVIAATTGPALVALSDPNYTKDVALGFGSYQVIDPYKAWDTFNGDLLLNTIDTRSIQEENTAGYVRADVNVLPNLLLVGGARWERRTIDAQGRTGNLTRARLSNAHIDFDSWYPSLTVKYTPRRNLVLRGGVSRTIGIPDYGEILPTFTAPSTPTSTDGVIAVPAADLKPYATVNFDVGADYYLKNSGVISVSAFRKNVSDYIVSRGMTAAERSQYLALYGFNEAEFGVTPGTLRENGSKSRLQGFEVSYAQNLTMLPGLLNGLSVQANFSLVDIDAFDSDRFRALDTMYSQLRAVAPKTVNVILGYRYKNFNTTITNNWVSESLYGGFVNTNYFTGSANTTDLSKDTRLTLNKDEKLTTDIKLEYSFNKRISTYVVIRNVFNTPRREFLRGYLPEQKNVILPLRYFEFGEPHLSVGVRGTF
ncbi:MAG TPA: TonB-dependent receptor [Opitutus sp.]|nr:TonB-dependent receptor [Opitutus sp.]